jgi:hypothetical protein
MQLAHSADYGVPNYGFCLNSNGRILLGKIAQRSLKPLAVIIAPRTDGHRYYETVLGVRFHHGAESLAAVEV